MRGTVVRPWPLRWIVVAGMTLLGVTAVFPVLFMLQAAFRTQLDWAAAKIGLPTTFSLDAFARAWVEASIGRYFINSLIVTLGAVALSVALAATSGYAFSTIRWRGRTFTYFFILAWMAIPPLLLMVPIYVEMSDLGLVDTYWSVILLYSALNLPFNMYLMTAFFRVDSLRTRGGGPGRWGERPHNLPRCHAATLGACAGHPRNLQRSVRLE